MLSLLLFFLFFVFLVKWLKYIKKENNFLLWVKIYKVISSISFNTHLIIKWHLILLSVVKMVKKPGETASKQ